MEEPKILTEVNDEISERLRKSFSITVFMGAGTSAGSGIPTFRGANKDGYFQADYNPSYLYSLQGFAQYPTVAWQYFSHIYQLVNRATPNMAHQTLAKWQNKTTVRRGNVNLYLLTINYDGLFKQVGGQAEELYGNINDVICSKCQQTYLMEQLDLSQLPPLCACGGILMPNIVLMGALMKDEHYQTCLTATRGCSVYIAVGTSGVNCHSYGFMKAVKMRPKTTLIEINPRPSHLTKDMTYVLRGKAEEILPQFGFEHD